jgi:uncharacterized repeat protein (TIGR01451 family)
LRPADGGARVSRIRGILAAAVLAALVMGGSASARPLAAAIPGLSVAPTSASHFLGESHTLTATAAYSGGTPAVGEPITFSIVAGPNAGLTGGGTTDAAGHATFTYTGTKVGTDTIRTTNTRWQQVVDASVTWAARADVKVTIVAPAFARVGQPATFKATITNSGPDTATGVLFKAATPPGATLVSESASQGAACSAGNCPIGTLAPNASATVTIVYTVPQTGVVTLGTNTESDFDPNTSNNAASISTTAIAPGAAPPPPPVPSQPGTFNAVGTGTIRVNGTDRPADQLFQLNAGDTVDVTDGVITFTAADGSYGSFSASQPTARSTASATRAAANLPAQFTVSQPVSGGPTTLALAGGDFSTCAGKRSVSAASKKPVRGVWGSAKGSFQTKGRYASATVRGTIWLVQDRCDGTLTQVVEGTVDVADATRHKTVSVPAGSSYLATAPLSIPRQTAAQVKKRGLLYAGHMYKTKKVFTSYLKSVGWTWNDFAKQYRALASALARRK